MTPSLTRVKKLLIKTVYSVVPPPYIPASYSQAGEDGVLRFLFEDRRMKQISYLDVGTNHPNHYNNTYLFYRSGSRGVCVEADKTLISEIRRVRPGDKVVNAGVAAGSQTEADFYVFDQKALNTFDEESARGVVDLGVHKIVETVRVPLVNINTLISDNFERFPDLLSLDIEGLDLSVLKTLDFDRYPLPVICVETCFFSETHIRPKNPSIAEFMLTKGYETYADTYINTIFVNQKWFHRSS